MCPSLAEPDLGSFPRSNFEMFHVKHFVATVPVEQLQRKCLTEKPAPRENGLQRPAKGGSTPAFACQHAAIAPLPCPNLQLVSQWQSNCELVSFKRCNCSRENLLQNNLLRKRGLLAHTSAAFLKNCCTEKLFSCLRLVFYYAL